MDLFIKIYCAVGVVLLLIYLAIHLIEVAPLLRKYNASGILTWFTNLNHFRDLEKYKELCNKEKKPLFWYNLLSTINKYTIFYLIVLIVTLLLST
jgi:hypothetical protein